MKPVAIFRHTPTEGPGYISTFLDGRHIPWQLIAIDAGDAVPRNTAAFSGLVFMGGPMSVNDALPWIPEIEILIRDAVAKDIPLLGHCLGGQLISKALGAKVSRNPVKEIGWGRAEVSDNDIARSWFGDIQNFEAFHWHGETFSLPEGATHLLSSAYCINQAYSIGKHLALQCHVEMTAEMIATWCVTGADEVAAAINSPAVQSIDAIQKQMSGKLPLLKRVADQLYTKWCGGL
jgi:GMP synthase-like glutamine amidotransferase